MPSKKKTEEAAPVETPIETSEAKPKPKPQAKAPATPCEKFAALCVQTGDDAMVAGMLNVSVDILQRWKTCSEPPKRAIDTLERRLK